MFDFIHPSPEGYDLLTPYIEDFMVDLITAPKSTEEETSEELVPEIETETVEARLQDTTVSSEKNGFGCQAAISGMAEILTCVALSVGALLCRRRQKYNDFWTEWKERSKRK